MCSYAHALMTPTAVARLWPSGVSRYSTVTGTVGRTVRELRRSYAQRKEQGSTDALVFPMLALAVIVIATIVAFAVALTY